MAVTFTDPSSKMKAIVEALLIRLLHMGKSLPIILKCRNRCYMLTLHSFKGLPKVGMILIVGITTDA